MIAELRERVVRDRDDALARISIDRPERVELLEIDLGDARFFAQLARRRLVEGLVEVDEAARQGPRVLERRELALDQEHLEIGDIEPEHDAVDRQRGARIVIRVRH